MMASNRQNRRQRDHIPALDSERLRGALALLDQSGLPPAAKRQLRAMLEAAANPDAEAPDVVIQSLEPERQANVLGTIMALNRFTGGLVQRGGAELMQMSDDEFNTLVDEANG